MLSYEQLIELVPKKQKNLVSPELVETINAVASDPLIADNFKQNFITYMSVINTGKYSMEEYKSAVQFVTLKLLGSSDIDAYMRTFPDRYRRLRENGLDRSQISPYVSAYRKNKLVVGIIEQTMVEGYIYNAHMYQEALDVQRDLMLTARSEMVRSTAASSLLANLKPPEAAKLEVDINLNKGSIVDDYEAVMRKLAAEKKQMIEAGGDIKSVANYDIVIDIEPEE